MHRSMARCVPNNLCISRGYQYAALLRSILCGRPPSYNASGSSTPSRRNEQHVLRDRFTCDWADIAKGISQPMLLAPKGTHSSRISPHILVWEETCLVIHMIPLTYGRVWRALIEDANAVSFFR